MALMILLGINPREKATYRFIPNAKDIQHHRDTFGSFRSETEWNSILGWLPSLITMSVL
jgi:hypothetical protein